METKSRNRTLAIGIAVVAIILGGIVLFGTRQQELAKPDLPVNVTMRKAILSSGLVAQIQNRGTSELVVAVTARSPTTNQQNNWRLVLPPGKTEEIGQREGWAFAAGDELEIVDNGHRPIKMRVNG